MNHHQNHIISLRMRESLANQAQTRVITRPSNMVTTNPKLVSWEIKAVSTLIIPISACYYLELCHAITFYL